MNDNTSAGHAHMVVSGNAARNTEANGDLVSVAFISGALIAAAICLFWGTTRKKGG